MYCTRPAITSCWPLAWGAILGSSAYVSTGYFFDAFGSGELEEEFSIDRDDIIFGRRLSFPIFLVVAFLGIGHCFILLTIQLFEKINT